MKTTALFVLTLILTVFSASAHADSGKFTVKGMHCQDCADSIKEKVCKMDGLEACDVTVGSITMTTKPGVKLDEEKVAALLAKAGEKYKVTNVEIAPENSKASAPTTATEPAPAPEKK
jgi:mercuric ion binding protein